MLYTTGKLGWDVVGQDIPGLEMRIGGFRGKGGNMNIESMNIQNIIL